MPFSISTSVSPPPFVSLSSCGLLFSVYGIGFGLTLIQYNFILTWLHVQRPHFQVGSHTEILSEHELWGERGALFNPVQSSSLCKECKMLSNVLE